MIGTIEMEQYMRFALEQAQLAAESGEVPVGAVLVCNGEVIAHAQPPMKALLAPPEWEGEIGLASLAHRADWPPLATLREALAPAPPRLPARPRKAPRKTPRSASTRIDLS